MESGRHCLSTLFCRHECKHAQMLTCMLITIYQLNHNRSGKYIYQGDEGIDRNLIEDNDVFAFAYKPALTVL